MHITNFYWAFPIGDAPSLLLVLDDIGVNKIDESSCLPGVEALIKEKGDR